MIFGIWRLSTSRKPINQLTVTTYSNTTQECLLKKKRKFNQRIRTGGCRGFHNLIFWVFFRRWSLQRCVFYKRANNSKNKMRIEFGFKRAGFYLYFSLGSGQYFLS